MARNMCDDQRNVEGRFCGTLDIGMGEILIDIGIEGELAGGDSQMEQSGGM